MERLVQGCRTGEFSRLVAEQRAEIATLVAATWEWLRNTRDGQP
jgi:hypothetical protein